MDNIDKENQEIFQEFYESEITFTKGISSVNPNLTSVQEVILLYLKELSFYLLKLKNFGITNNKIKETVMYAIFNIITNAEYNQDQFHALISNLYEYINQSKILYEKYCLEHDILIEVPKTYFKYSKSFDLSDAIRKGEKYFLKRSQFFTPKQKDLYEIVLFLGKSMGVKILELQRLGADHDEGYYNILLLFNTIVPRDFSEETVEKQIAQTIEVYYDTAKKVFYKQIELYGNITPTEVSFSTKPGKAILVSGSDFKKLELVLKATEGTPISVYTHGMEMLMAHAFPKIKAHPNLAGHFGSGLESSLIDFASFPGAILMTRGTLQKVEYLYRGRLYTLDPIAPPGCSKIEDFNFEPLIKSALEAKGFTHETIKPPMKVGFCEQEIIKKIDDIIDKIKAGEINYLYFVGLLNAPNPVYKSYFEEFFKLMPKDCYVFSLCCPINTEKIYHLDSFYDYSLIYKILKEIKTKISIRDLNLTIFLTRCDKHTISNLLYLKHIGIKNIYMCKCPTTLITPSIIKTLTNTFGIKEITAPQKDLNETLNK
ncbi:MAG: hypothetical protein PHC64_01205 [Candidatus Gastranaerophilales bacterium]|nr:hypothetical protein [Candidatus Gastranaerophilales bacterium]